MNERPTYHIETFDLKDIKDIKFLHQEFARILKFPDFYGNNWNAFWDAITGLIDMPTNLILYNYKNFSDRFEEDAKILGKIVLDYNDSLKSEVIQFDNLDGLIFNIKPKSLACIFSCRPFQYGLRGDKYLWDDLENHFKNIEVPKYDDEFIELIYIAIEELTGNKLNLEKFIMVEKYKHGGMSSGEISGEFWIKRGIPLLIGRYRKIKDSWQHTL
jgi:RNAse (barnase) inhibitor barstar